MPAIGGKNGVNLDGYKNMIGIIRQPSFVWCDLSLLKTLSHREYVSGIAEVIKYGAIRDRGFLQYLQDHMPGLLAQDPKVLEHVVTTSAAIKVEVVQKDEKESDLRRILNFGHTIGHAIERNKRYCTAKPLLRGWLWLQGFHIQWDSYPLRRLIWFMIWSLLQVCQATGTGSEEIFQNIRKDKKKSGDQLHFVLLDGLGNAL